MDNKRHIATKATNKSHMAKQALAILMAVLTLLGALLLIDDMDKKPELSTDLFESETLPVTTYITVEPNTYQANITALGETKPRWNTPIRSFVRGEVTYISPSLSEGSSVKKGELLLKIQDSAYQADVAEARKNVEQASLQLLQAKRNTQQARKNWQRAGLEVKPDSPLIFKEPQLQVAQEELAAAKTRLAHTETLLKYTILTAPYDGIILTRAVNPGEFIESGQLLFQIIDSLTLDIPIMLNSQQWQQLSPKLLGSSARINSMNRELQWEAQVQRKGSYIDKKTRLRQVYLSYQQDSNQTEKLLPGEFVKVNLLGRSYENLLKLPQSVYTRDKVIWFLNSSNVLTRYRTVPVFSDSDFFYFTPPAKAESSSLRVVMFPLSSFYPGMLVQALPFSDTQNASSKASIEKQRQLAKADLPDKMTNFSDEDWSDEGWSDEDWPDEDWSDEDWSDENKKSETN